MKVMVLAAGEGTRLRPHTLKLPKPSIPFLGAPLAFHSLSLFEDPSDLDIVVNTFHLPDKIEATYQGVANKFHSLSFSSESGFILGSGGGLKKAQSLLNTTEPFFMLNADEVILPSDSKLMQRAYEHHLKSKNICTLLVMKHPLVGSKFGGVWTKESMVQGFGKTSPRADLEAWHFLGIQILSPDIFEFLPEGKESNILYDGVTAALANGATAGIFEVDGHWFETGNPFDFLTATKECIHHFSEQNTFGRHLQKTIENYLKDSFYLVRKESGLSLVAETSRAAFQRVIASGSNVIGSNLNSLGQVEIQNSVVGNDLTLFAGERIIDTILI